MKRKFSLILTVILLVFSFGGMVTAATVDDVLAALADANVPEAYIEQAKSYFNDNPITADEADQLIGYIEAAAAIAGDKTKISELTGAERSAIFAEISNAAQVIGLTVSYDDNSIIIRDASGNIVFSESGEGAVKQTGHDYSIVLFGLGGLMLAGVAAIALKKKLPAEAS